MLKDTLVYTTANYLSQAIGIFNSVFLRLFMGPVAMGVWSVLQVVLGYCGHASFGTTRALARDYPYSRGAGDHKKAEQLKDMTLTFTMIMSLIPAVLIALYLWKCGNGLEPAFRIGLQFLMGFLFVQRFYDLVITLCRSDKKFKLLSGFIILNAVGGLAITFLLVRSWNIYGLLAGTACVTLGSLFFLLRYGQYSFRFFWDRKILMEELRLGLPLVASAFFYEFFRGLDKLLIAKHLGFFEVGLYSLAMMVSSYVVSAPSMFAHIWYPNLQEEFGRVQKVNEIARYLQKPVMSMTILIPVLSGLAIFLMPLLIETVLPQFKGGLPALKFYLAGTLFTLIAQYSDSFLVTLSKYWVNPLALLIFIPLSWFLNLALLRWEMAGVASGTALSFMLHGATLYLIATAHFQPLRKSLFQLGQIFAILMCFFGVITAMEFWIRLPNLFLDALAKCALFLIFSFPFLSLLERRTQIMSGIFSVLTKGFRRNPKRIEEAK